MAQSGEVKHKMICDSSQYTASLEKIISGQNKVIRSLQDMRKDSMQAEAQVDRLGKSLTRMGKTVLGGLGISGVINGLTIVIDKYNEVTKKMADKGNVTADARRVWSQSMPPDQRMKRDKELGALRAKYAVTDENAVYDLSQSLYAKTNGDWAKTQAATEAGLQAMATGIQGQAVRDSMAAMSAAGMPLDVGPFLIHAVGEKSFKSPEEASPLVRALPFYKNKVLGAALAVPMMDSLPGGDEWATYLSRAGEALNTDAMNTPEGKFWSRLGVLGKTEEEKLAALVKAGLGTQKDASGKTTMIGPTDLISKIGEIRESFGLAIAANSFREAQQFAGTMQGEISSGSYKTYVGKKLQNTLLDPLVENQFRQNQELVQIREGEKVRGDDVRAGIRRTTDLTTYKHIKESKGIGNKILGWFEGDNIESGQELSWPGRIIANEFTSSGQAGERTRLAETYWASKRGVLEMPAIEKRVLGYALGMDTRDVPDNKLDAAIDSNLSGQIQSLVGVVERLLGQYTPRNSTELDRATGERLATVLEKLNDFVSANTTPKQHYGTWEEEFKARAGMPTFDRNGGVE